MRRMKICEELGSGWDGIAEICEKRLLPAPELETENAFTRVTVYAPIPYGELSKEDRLWACCLHACSEYENGRRVTNQSLRTRFGLEKIIRSRYRAC